MYTIICSIIIWSISLYYILNKKIFIYQKFLNILSEEEKKKFHIFLREDILEINKLNLFLKSFFLVPIRIIGYLIILISGFIILKILCFVYKINDLDKEQPKEFILISRKFINIWLNGICFLFGFNIKYKIHKTDKPSTKEELENCKIIVSNHVSWFDIKYFLTFKPLPGIISNDSIKNIPFIGFYAQVIQTVFINRSSKEDRSIVMKKIQERVENYKNNKNFNPLLIFPEGTTKRSNYLIPFKKGAFVCDLPIKMIVLDYQNNKFNPEYVLFDQLGSFIFTFSNLFNNLTVYEIDQLLYPNNYKKDGIIDWEKMSKDCQKLMASTCNLEIKNCEDVYNLVKEYNELRKRKFKELN